jgi:TfoX/Sxy family transcriptional regulator of competence genes
MMVDQMNAAKFADILEDVLREIEPDAIFRWKRMFGGAAYYADDRQFGGWYRSETISLKLADDDRDALLQIEGSQMGMGKQSVEVPPTWLEDTIELRSWLEKSLAYVATLPEKKKR